MKRKLGRIKQEVAKKLGVNFQENEIIREGAKAEFPLTTFESKAIVHKKTLSGLIDRVQRIWQLPTLPHFCAVPSAIRGLTSLFGMGRGEHPWQNHHKILHSFSC